MADIAGRRHLDEHQKESDKPSGKRDFIPLDSINPPDLRTRDLDEKHVEALAESIGAIGLIHPPAVDRSNLLLAGAHRFAALRWLQRKQTARFQELFPEGVPVWRMDLDAQSETDRAFAIEISENEQRRDYTRGEIIKLAERLKAAGFHYANEGGRPKADVHALMPALETVVGKSVRQLRRILNPPKPRQVSSIVKRQPPAVKTRSNDLVFELRELLESSGKLAERLTALTDIPEVFSLKAQLERVCRQTNAALVVVGNGSGSVARSD